MKVAVLLARIIFVTTVLISVETQSQNLSPRPGVPGESTVLINGRVVTEDNSPPPQNVTVVLDCMGRQPVEVNTSPGGNFSFSVRRTDSLKADSTQLQDLQRNESASLAACELNAKLAGYSAQALHPSIQGPNIGVSDVGT